MLTVSAGALTATAGAAAAGGVKRLRRCADTRSWCSRGRSAVFGDHVHSRDGKAVLSQHLLCCPVRFTSWPTYALRSALLVVILKILPVLSSATV